MSRVPLIHNFMLIEVRRVRMNLRILTLNRTFLVRRITYENNNVVVIYREGNTQNWIKITSSRVILFLGGRYRRLAWLMFLYFYNSLYY